MPEELDALRARIDLEIERQVAALLVEAPERDHPLVGRVYRWLRHYLDASGKRMHGLAAILAFRACAPGPHESIVPVAAALQLYHHHTLVHDDIYDEDDSRRGWPTSQRAFASLFEERARAAHGGRGSLFVEPSLRYGTISAFAYGKICRALTGHRILAAGFPPEARLDVAAALEWHDLHDNAAQLKDVYHEGCEMPSSQQCLDNAWLKTGRLFEVCAFAGARFANASEARMRALEAWAGKSALAYQMQDDLEDLEIDSEKGQGRGVGTDLLSCKPTYLYASAKELANATDRAVLTRWQSGDAGDLGMHDLVDILHRSGAVERCREQVRRCVELAGTALELPAAAFAPQDRELMTCFTSYFVSPAYWRRAIDDGQSRARRLLA